VAVHGVHSDGYQGFFNTWTAKGFVPVIISATGTVSNAVFAAVFQQGITGAWFAEHGMVSGAPTEAETFQHANAAAVAAQQILSSVAIYDTSADRRYAAGEHANPVYVKWHAHPSDSGASYQVAFNAETQLPGYRLAGYRPALCRALQRRDLLLRVERRCGGLLVARHGMTSSEYQTEFNQQVATGLYPICIQRGGSTNAPV
jgi:Bacterial tandem repeat domain 1